MKEEEIYEDITKSIEIAIKKQKIAIEMRKLYTNIPNEQLIKIIGEFLDQLSELDKLSKMQKDNENHIPKID